MDQINVRNLAPKFLKFYELASQEGLDVEVKWKLWLEHYQFAAVPPGDEGREIARKLLFDAWEKYGENLEHIKNWSPNTTRIQEILSMVKSVLGCKEDIHLTVVYFVGAFEGNPFVAPISENEYAVCLPVETEITDIFLAHELTHIVHGVTANLAMRWERPIAEIIVQEGLATHVSKLLNPGLKDGDYINHRPDWLEECEKNRETILKGVVPFLEDSTSEAAFKFTMGNGASGFEREAYFAGWEFVKKLLENGVTFEQIAKTQEKDIPSFVKQNFEGVI